MKRRGDPQPIILPEVKRKSSYSWAFQPTVADRPQSSVVASVVGYCGNCGSARSASDRYCGYCGCLLA